jgi:Ribosomal protein L3
MVKDSKPRAGSLQFWPRKRAEKFIPGVNWEAIKTDSHPNLLGFIAYKVGMKSCLAKDSTANSLTKDKRIILPATILELPPMKILSVRFYKYGIVKDEVLAENLDKELKRKIKLPKVNNKKIDDIKDYDNIKVIVYSMVKKTGIKKTPDITEIALSGNLEDKLKFVKERMGKEIFASEILGKSSLMDVRGLTTGRGLCGPVKRFGVKLKQHKSEKGQRRPGNLAPWHPCYVTFRAPQAGQLGMFTRVQYNSKILKLGKINESNINPEHGWKNYGNIKNEYLILAGSVQGPAKRQLLLTAPLRPTRYQTKLQYEVIKLV